MSKSYHAEPIGNCIGFKNKKMAILTTFYSFLCNIFQVIVSITLFYQTYQNNSSWDSHRMIRLLFLVFTFSLIFYFGALTYYQLYLAVKNITLT